MKATLSPRAAVLILLVISVVFGANHIAARVSFDHGTSVITAVFARAAATSLVLLVLMRLTGVSMSVPRPTVWRGLIIGLLVTTQSFCVFSAVARIPVALALLAFYVFPILLALLTWAVDGQRPTGRAAVAMVLAFIGLGFALDLVGGGVDIAGRWQDIGAGVMFGLGAAVSFALMFFLTGRWMQDVDGRMRAFLAVSVTAVVMLAFGIVASGFALPSDATGWYSLALLCLLYGVAITATFMVQPLPGVSRFTGALNFEPIAVLFMGWAILGQSVKPLQILGAFIVIGAVVLLGTARK